jgi:hypothetical protein
MINISALNSCFSLRVMTDRRWNAPTLSTTPKKHLKKSDQHPAREFRISGTKKGTLLDFVLCFMLLIFWFLVFNVEMYLRLLYIGSTLNLMSCTLCNGLSAVDMYTVASLSTICYISAVAWQIESPATQQAGSGHATRWLASHSQSIEPGAQLEYKYLYTRRMS